MVIWEKYRGGGRGTTEGKKGGKVFANPGCARGRESFVNSGFVQGETKEGFLEVDWTGIHGGNEFHDGNRERCVAV